ncbi:TPA: tail fiber assembly protein [Enterobacter roggenkampii]|uniref:tail fiber assembly protein n=1 Tax=Enterobacter roggenkampii TaxID=1812935 RepID=UPI0032AEE85E
MKPVFDSNGLATKAGELRCYYYSAKNAEYTGWSEEFINVGVSMPARSTDIDPGEMISGFVYVYSGSEWSLVEDHRGEKVYKIDTGDELTINEIGPYPTGTTTTKPEPTNEQKRKTALAALSSTYQDDIEKLNRAWLAAAVNDGVNETAKKDVVLAQINTRKTQYATDRAAIIAQYP